MRAWTSRRSSNESVVDASLLVYLNVPMPKEQARLVESFWEELLREHSLYTNLLVFNEVIHVSKKRYGVEHGETLEFLDRVVLPHVELLPVGADLYRFFKFYVLELSLIHI